MWKDVPLKGGAVAMESLGWNADWMRGGTTWNSVKDNSGWGFPAPPPPHTHTLTIVCEHWKGFDSSDINLFLTSTVSTASPSFSSTVLTTGLEGMMERFQVRGGGGHQARHEARVRCPHQEMRTWSFQPQPRLCRADGSARKVTRLWAGRCGLDFGIFSLRHRCVQAGLGSTQPPVQCVQGDLSPGVKQPGRETDHCPPCSKG
jgi:hypothetical protein